MRRFGTKGYRLKGWIRTKHDAMVDAASERREGNLVRILKVKSRRGGYNVYVHKK